MTEKDVRRAMAYEQQAIYEGVEYRVGERYVVRLNKEKKTYDEYIELIGHEKIWADINRVELIELTAQETQAGFKKYIMDK